MSESVVSPPQARMNLLWPVPGVLLMALGALLWFAPTEATLGQGIKIVYVHVASMWVGLTWFLGLCAIALWLLFRHSEKGTLWAQIVIWMAVSWYAIGLGTSMLAAKINWGGIFWGEPRMAMSLRCLLVGFAIAVLALWISKPRPLGGIVLIAPAYLFWSLANTPLRLHPRNPISGDGATSIQTTFLVTYLLLLLLTVWLGYVLVRWLGHREENTATA